MPQTLSILSAVEGSNGLTKHIEPTERPERSRRIEVSKCA
jgi:hypothetical protein